MRRIAWTLAALLSPALIGSAMLPLTAAAEENPFADFVDTTPTAAGDSFRPAAATPTTQTTPDAKTAAATFSGETVSGDPVDLTDAGDDEANGLVIRSGADPNTPDVRLRKATILPAAFETADPQAAGTIQQIGWAEDAAFAGQPASGFRSAAAEESDVEATDTANGEPAPLQPTDEADLKPIQSASAIPTTVPSGPNTFTLTAATAAPVASLRPTVPSQPSGSAAVSLDWSTRGPVNLGQPAACLLTVTNSGQGPATGVSVEAAFPPTVRLLATEPQPAAADRSLVWSLADLAPGQSRQILIRFVASAAGKVEPVASVRYASASQGSFAVLQPAIAAQVATSPAVRVGEPAPQTIVLTNPGTGVAQNVQIEVSVPRGLSHPAGSRIVTDVGPLHPGETRSIRVALTATEGGRHPVNVRAIADGGLQTESTGTVTVASPKLAAAIDGPKLRYLGRTGEFTLTVSNEGQFADENVRLMHKVPAGYEFVSASRGSRFDPTTRVVSWYVGQVGPGEFKSVRLTLRATAAGEQTHYVRVIGGPGVQSDAQLLTRVEAVESLVVAVSDLDDPVEVGREVVYEVKISNEGSAAARGVRLVCQIPRGCTVAEADAPIAHQVAGDTMTFAPIVSIAPGQTQSIRVKLTAGANGRGLFRASVSSEAGDPVVAEEVTRFYGE